MLPQPLLQAKVCILKRRDAVNNMAIPHLRRTSSWLRWLSCLMLTKSSVSSMYSARVASLLYITSTCERGLSSSHPRLQTRRPEGQRDTDSCRKRMVTACLPA